MQTETYTLDSTEHSVDPSAVSTIIASGEPRYTFYKYPSNGAIVFIYTCPGTSKIKEKMVYASSRTGMVNLAERDAGLTIAKRLEGSSPDDFPADVLSKEFEEVKTEKAAFARPKRPGRR